MTLGVVEFGDGLLRTGDLDPLYLALFWSGMDDHQMARWLLCYWCYYHAGLCSVVSEYKGRRYWDKMSEVANGGTDYPRGTERRHFRGKLSIASIDSLRSRFHVAGDAIQYLVKRGLDASVVMKQVTTLHGFGSWISWKVADMLERLDIASVRFSTGDLRYMFKSSKDGADETCRRHVKSRREPTGEARLVLAHHYILKHLGGHLAPPRYDREINVQETETVFCKWKSHLGGHYPIGKDTRDILEGLERFDCRTSRSLAKAIRKHVKCQDLGVD